MLSQKASVSKSAPLLFVLLHNVSCIVDCLHGLYYRLQHFNLIKQNSGGFLVQSVFINSMKKEI